MVSLFYEARFRVNLKKRAGFFFFSDLRTQSGAVHEDLYLVHAPEADNICIIAYAKNTEQHRPRYKTRSTALLVVSILIRVFGGKIVFT